MFFTVLTQQRYIKNHINEKHLKEAFYNFLYNYFYLINLTLLASKTFTRLST